MNWIDTFQVLIAFSLKLINLYLSFWSQSNNDFHNHDNIIIIIKTSGQMMIFTCIIESTEGLN